MKKTRVFIILVLVVVVLVLFVCLWFQTASVENQFDFIIWNANHGIVLNFAIDKIVEDGRLVHIAADKTTCSTPSGFFSSESTKEEHVSFDSLYILSLYMMNHTDVRNSELSCDKFEYSYKQLISIDPSLFEFRRAFYYAEYRKQLTINHSRARSLAEYFEACRGLYPEKNDSDFSAILTDYSLFMQVSLNLMTQEDLYNHADEEHLAKEAKETQVYILEKYNEYRIKRGHL